MPSQQKRKTVNLSDWSDEQMGQMGQMGEKDSQFVTFWARPSIWMGRSSFRSLCLSALLVNSNTLASWPWSSGRRRQWFHNLLKVACNKSAGWHCCCNRIVSVRYTDSDSVWEPATSIYIVFTYLFFIIYKCSYPPSAPLAPTPSSPPGTAGSPSWDLVLYAQRSWKNKSSVACTALGV